MVQPAPPPDLPRLIRPVAAYLTATRAETENGARRFPTAYRGQPFTDRVRRARHKMGDSGQGTELVPDMAAGWTLR